MLRRLASPLKSGGFVRWGLVVLIVFTPLAFGTVEGWSIALLEWGIVSLVIAAVAARLLSDRGEVAGWRQIGVEWPLGLYVALVGIQVIPLPVAVVRPIAPGAVHAREAAETMPTGGVTTPADFRALREFLGLQAPPSWVPISVNPGETWAKGRLLAALILLFLLVARWGSRTERALFLLRAVLVTGFVVALFGIVQQLTWNGKLYWIRPTSHEGGFGPFVNRNHFAGYVEMILPLAIAMAYYFIDLRRRQTSEDPVAASGAGADGDWLDDSQAVAGRWGQWVLALFAAVLLLGSLVLSQSRGGLLSATLGSGLLFAALWKRIRPRALAWGMVAALPILAVLLAVWIGSDLLRLGNPGHSIEREASFHSRWVIWKVAAHHLPEAGAAGFGLGTFEESFAPYTPRGTAQRWDRAHNDYLQIAWETGGIGTLLILWGGLAFGIRYVASALRSPAHPLDLFRVAIAVSLTSLLLHSVVDFNLQIGSNAFLFALLAGLLVGLHRIVERDTAAGDEPDTATTQRLRLAGEPRILESVTTEEPGGGAVKRPVVLGLLAIAFLLQSVYFARLTWSALLELRGQRAYLRNDLVGAWDLTRRAAAYGGDRARLEGHLIEILLMGFNQRDVGVRIDSPFEDAAGAEEARRLLHRRLSESPHQASLWSYAANLFLHRAHEERRSSPIDLSALSENPMENLLPDDRLGLASLEKAAAVEPNNYLYHELLVEQFLEFGSEADAARSARLAVTAFPRLDGHTYLSRFDLPPAVVDAALQGFDDALRDLSLVARVEILRDAGRLLVRHNRDQEVLPYLVDANRLDPDYYDARMDLAMVRLRLEQWTEAGQDLEAAIRLLPDDPTAYFHLARVKRHAGDDEGAIEELKRARARGASETKIFLAMGESLESLNRMKEAENQFIAATNLHPDDASAWSGLYAFAMRHGDRRGAARACARLGALKDVDARTLQQCVAQAGGGV